MKNNIYIEQFDFYRHQRLAQQAIEQQAAEQPDMLGFTMEKFQGYPLGVIAHLACQEFIGFNAVIYEYSQDACVEVGGLYIAPEHRGNKYVWPIKKLLHELIANSYPTWRAITFTNESSTPINKKIGFTEATLVPEEALSYCQKECNRYKSLTDEQVCCHKILELPLKGESS